MSVTIETRPTISKIGHIGYLIDGLIAYWKCDEGSGLTIADIHGGHTGTLSNATFNATGKLGTCVQSDYFGDYISFPDSGSFNQIYDQVSISFWIRFNSLPMGTGTYNYIVQITNGLGDSTIGIIIDDADNRIVYSNRINGSTNYSNDYTYSSVITNISTFMHVVCVTQGIGQSFKIYINGADDTQRVWGSVGNILPVYGATHYLMNNGGVRAMFGYMDEIGIWSRALTLTEIQRLYNSNVGLTYPF